MKKIFFGLAGLVMTLVVLAIIYGTYLNQAGESNIIARMADRKLNLHGSYAKVRDIHARVLLGTVNLYTNNMTDTIALAEGRIQAMDVQKNDHVSKGQVLFHLVNEQQPVKLRQAEIDILKADRDILKADGDISRAESALAKAANDYGRYGRLRARDAVTQEKFDEVESVYKSAQVNLDIAKVQKEQAIAQRDYLIAQKEQLQIQDSYSQVTAPINGNVLLLYEQTGAYVTAGTPLALVGDFSKLYFNLSAKDEEARGMATGQDTKINFNRADFAKIYDTKYVAGNAGANQEFTARIVEISPELSQPAAMRTVLWEVDNSAGLLEPQTYTNVSLQSQVKSRVLSVPLLALDSSRSEIFVYHEDGFLEKRHVETGVDDGTYIEILSGLKEGEVVVVSGTDGLADGTKANIIMETEEG